MCLSTNGLKTILFFMILTSNTEATENKVRVFNYAYTVKGFQCHSNNSLQLFELKGKSTTKQYTLFKRFLCDSIEKRGFVFVFVLCSCCVE